jgi:integrase
MLARGKTPKHVDQYYERAGKLVGMVRGVRVAELDTGRKAEAQERAARTLADALASARLSDLAPDRVQAALGRLRDAGKSIQTVNHYRAALRAFCRWAWDNGRLRDIPLRGVKGFNPEEDRRHERRSLADDELARLVQAAKRGRKLFGMPGPLRAMAYRVAAATGFRAQELRTLTPEGFHLNGSDPSVILAASATKNRRPAEQPVPVALARDLAAWLADRPAGSSVFPLHHETAKAIRVDLAAAGIPYETDEGVVDFHSLRACFVSALVRAGASIKEVQALARHAKPQTTLNHYTKVSLRDLRGAVESLPSPAPVVLAATGTRCAHRSERFVLPLPYAGDGAGHFGSDTGRTVATMGGQGDTHGTPSREGFTPVLSASEGPERRGQDGN